MRGSGTALVDRESGTYVTVWCFERGLVSQPYVSNPENIGDPQAKLTLLPGVEQLPLIEAKRAVRYVEDKIGPDPKCSETPGGFYGEDKSLARVLVEKLLARLH